MAVCEYCGEEPPRYHDYENCASIRHDVVMGLRQRIAELEGRLRDARKLVHSVGPSDERGKQGLALDLCRILDDKRATDAKD